VLKGKVGLVFVVFNLVMLVSGVKDVGGVDMWFNG